MVQYVLSDAMRYDMVRRELMSVQLKYESVGACVLKHYVSYKYNDLTSLSPNLSPH